MVMLDLWTNTNLGDTGNVWKTEDCDATSAPVSANFARGNAGCLYGHGQTRFNCESSTCKIK